MTGQRKNSARLAPDEARLARMLKALGNPIRFQIIKTLAERQTCITHEIVATRRWRSPPSANTSRCCGSWPDPGSSRRPSHMLLPRPGWGALAQRANRRLAAECC